MVRSPKYTIGLGGEYTFNLDSGARVIVGTDAKYRDREFFLVNRQDYSVDPILSQKGYPYGTLTLGISAQITNTKLMLTLKTC